MKREEIMSQVISFRAGVKNDVKRILYNTLNLHYVRNITSVSRIFTIWKVSAELYHKPVLWNTQRRSWEFHITVILRVSVSPGNIYRQVLENSTFSSSGSDFLKTI